MKWLMGAGIAVVMTLAFGSIAAADNAAGGVGDPDFYVDGELYRTVGTPTDFSNTRAPDDSFDTIYAIDGQPNVAEGAPGDPGFNGGRWKVVPVIFDDYEEAVAMYDMNGSGDFDSDEEIEAAVMGGDATLGDVVKYFECPVIPVPGESS
jgi:hypothetical protein